jgi:hypothetical protein
MTVAIERLHLPREIVLAVDAIPINRRVAEQHAELALLGKRRIDRLNGAKEFLVDRHVPGGLRCRGVLPHLTKRCIRYGLTANEPVHEILIPGASEFDHDIVHRRGKAWIANERKAERVSLLVIVIALGEGD